MYALKMIPYLQNLDEFHKFQYICKSKTTTLMSCRNFQKHKIKIMKVHLITNLRILSLNKCVYGM